MLFKMLPVPGESFPPSCLKLLELGILSSWWLNQPLWKYARQNGWIFPNFRGENKKYLRNATTQKISVNYSQSSRSSINYCIHVTICMRSHRNDLDIAWTIGITLSASGSCSRVATCGSAAARCKYAICMQRHTGHVTHSLRKFIRHD